MLRVFPQIAHAMITAALHKTDDSAAFQDRMAELSQEAREMMRGQAGLLVLYGVLAESGADPRALAQERGQEPDELAQEMGTALAERAERWRKNRPSDDL